MQVTTMVFKKEFDKYSDFFKMDFEIIPRIGEYLLYQVLENEPEVYYVSNVFHFKELLPHDKESVQHICINLIPVGTKKEVEAHCYERGWIAKQIDISEPTQDGWMHTEGTKQLLDYLLENYSTFNYEKWSELTEVGKKEFFNQLQEKFDWLKYDWFYYFAKETYKALTNPETDIYSYYGVTR